MKTTIKDFVKLMKKQLRANAGRGHWRHWHDAKEEGPSRIDSNIGDFNSARSTPAQKRRACADIANIALMMAMQVKDRP